jgi:hypothetical protein
MKHLDTARAGRMCIDVHAETTTCVGADSALQTPQSVGNRTGRTHARSEIENMQTVR